MADVTSGAVFAELDQPVEFLRGQDAFRIQQRLLTVRQSARFLAVAMAQAAFPVHVEAGTEGADFHRALVAAMESPNRS
jgi:hypothetical protein